MTNKLDQGMKETGRRGDLGCTKGVRGRRDPGQVLHVCKELVEGDSGR